MFSGERLKLARNRRRLSGKELAVLAELTPVTVSKVENGHQPDEATVKKISRALNYPIDFFYMDSPVSLEKNSVSFRSLKKMSAVERDAALSSGAIGVSLYEWIERRFNLPETDLIDLSKERERPEVAARLLRQHWGLGDRPVGNLLKLYESRGIRVLSLSEDTANVDAFSFWYSDRPYIFLNQFKTAERSNFDSAHELGHLVLHFHAARQSANIDDAEKQADKFASAFLMPEADLKSVFSYVYTASQLIKAKTRWKVSAMALATRLHGLKMISDWSYRSIVIELGQRGYRKGEPLGVERETSTLLTKVFTELWKQGVSRSRIAEELNVPHSEVESLVFDLAGTASNRPTNAVLRLVE